MMRDMECRNLIIKNSMNVFGKIMQYGILINIIFIEIKYKNGLLFYLEHFAILRENHKT